MALCVPKTPTHVTDFQGHVLDQHWNVPNSANQLWVVSHVPSPGNNTVTITVGNSAIPFLSSVATGMVRLTQAATVTTPVNFTVECLGTNTARHLYASSSSIRNALFQSVLTSWPSQQGLPNNPASISEVEKWAITAVFGMLPITITLGLFTYFLAVLPLWNLAWAGWSDMGYAARAKPFLAKISLKRRKAATGSDDDPDVVENPPPEYKE
ncbi:hypothetical protein C8J57DRAFT_1526236 [Mycena rebaudengoi]|nr:hypothetical protein C8J57DRAFT_1526236 [Mycena rebaudengoi]